MKHRFITLLLITLCLSIQQLPAQDNYIVNGNIVNVRTGAGSNYKIIGTYEKGALIKVHSISNNWAKVQISDSEYGYISVDYITKEESHTNTDVESLTDKDSHDLVIGLLVAIGSLLTWFIVRLSRRCSKCGRWNAMRIIDKELIDKESSSIKKTETFTDKHGNKHENVCYVPATNYKYRVHKRCRRCGYLHTHITTEKKEN